MIVLLKDHVGSTGHSWLRTAHWCKAERGLASDATLWPLWWMVKP